MIIYFCDKFINLIIRLKKRLLVCEGAWEELESRRVSLGSINHTDTLLINACLHKTFSTYPFLVDVQTIPAIIQITVVVPREAGNRFTSRPSCTSLPHIPKGLCSLLHSLVLNPISGCSIHHCQKLERAKLFINR